MKTTLLVCLVRCFHGKMTAKLSRVVFVSGFLIHSVQLIGQTQNVKPGSCYSACWQEAWRELRGGLSSLAVICKVSL